MNKLIVATVLSFNTLFFTNCDKNDDPPAPPPPTKTELITKSSWKFSSAKAGGFDVTAQIPACFKDNTITFVSTGTGTISEGAVACSPAAPATFTWSFQNSETQINLNTPLISGGSGLFTIVKLDAVNLVVSQNMTIPPAPGPVNVELTFIH